MGEKLAGSASLAGGNTQLEDIIIHINDANPSVPVIESVDTASESLKNWVQDVVKDESSENQPDGIKQGGSWPKIEKVPEILREVKANSGCYDPVVVSIGPYHYGKSELKFMQLQKKTMARLYVNGECKSLETFCQKVSPLVKDARECYTYKEAVDKFSDEAFTQMMVLDACFILQYIQCIVNGKREELKMKSNMMALVQRDLFLLENQIPFKIIDKIMSVKFCGDKKKSMLLLDKFFKQILSLPDQAETCKTIMKKFPFNSLCRRKECVKDGSGKAEILDGEPAHLLDVMRSNLVGECGWKKKTQHKRKGSCWFSCRSAQELEAKGSYWFSYRSAQELKAKGIHFRVSKTNKFTDVCFRSLCFCSGYLRLPQIVIDDSTKSMLLNMVAHESSTDGPDDLGVSSYICFMDSLVDHAEDVKELRKKCIILNCLGSDQQVADLFNQISDNLVPHRDAYEEVKEMLEEHYKSKLKTWLAECWHTHFASPWTILAFFGAILALGMSFIQTYKSIKPST